MLRRGRGTRLALVEQLAEQGETIARAHQHIEDDHATLRRAWALGLAWHRWASDHACGQAGVSPDEAAMMARAAAELLDTLGGDAPP